LAFLNKMLIAYSKISQEGIKPLKKYKKAVKEKEGSHYYFDDFRIALNTYFNEKEKTSGVGILTFAPNGLLWSQSGVYCFQLSKIGSFYYGVDKALEEAEKSKAKNITIFINDKTIVGLLNNPAPFKDSNYRKVHNYLINKFKKFKEVKVVFRERFPKSVKARLIKEAKEASTPLLFSPYKGRCVNAKGVLYFNIGMMEGEERIFAEQYARLFVDFIEGYLKKYEDDYGKEALNKLIKKIKQGRIRKLPSLKKHIKKRKKTRKLKKFPKIKKVIFCQNCGEKMELEDCFLETPGKNLKYNYRCNACLATKILNENGRTVFYGRYPKEK